MNSDADIAPTTWTLTGSDGRPYESHIPGALGGHRRLRIYGRPAKHRAHGRYPAAIAVASSAKNTRYLT